MSWTISIKPKRPIKRQPYWSYSFTVRTFYLFSCILLSTTISGGSQVIAKQSPGDMYQNFRQAQIHATDCNKALAEKMQSVAAALARYRARHGRFPEEGNETIGLEKRLEQLAGANAYAAFEQYLSPAKPGDGTVPAGDGFATTAPAQAESGTGESARSELTVAVGETAVVDPLSRADLPTPVKIKVDLALSAVRLASFKRELPANWRAEPGTITIFHNTENYFLIWGAGLDGRPILADGTNAAFMLTPAAP